MASLTRCLLCGAYLRDGRNFDDLTEHVCEEVPPTERLPTTGDDAQAEREGRAEYVSELAEVVDEWFGI